MITLMKYEQEIIMHLLVCTECIVTDIKKLLGWEVEHCCLESSVDHLLDDWFFPFILLSTDSNSTVLKLDTAYK